MDEFSIWLYEHHSRHLLLLMDRTDESRESLVRAEKIWCCAPTKTGSNDNAYADMNKNTYRSRATVVNSSTARSKSIQIENGKTCNSSDTSCFSSPPRKQRRRIIKNAKDQEEPNRSSFRSSYQNDMAAVQVATTKSGCVSMDDMIGNNTNSSMFLSPRRDGRDLTTLSIATISVGTPCTAYFNNVETDYTNQGLDLNEESLEYLRYMQFRNYQIIKSLGNCCE